MNDGRRRLIITSEFVRKSMEVKGITFTDAVAWIIKEYRKAFDEVEQARLDGEIRKYLVKFMERIRPLPPWLSYAEVYDEMQKFFYDPVVKWHQGRGSAPSPAIAYYAHVTHAREHYSRWSAMRPRAMRSNLPELEHGEEPLAYLDERSGVEETLYMEDIPEPIRQYALLRASGRGQEEAGKILGASRRTVNKLEKWTRRFLIGTYDDERCRYELSRGVGKPKKK